MVAQTISLQCRSSELFQMKNKERGYFLESYSKGLISQDGKIYILNVDHLIKLKWIKQKQSDRKEISLVTAHNWLIEPIVAVQTVQARTSRDSMKKWSFTRSFVKFWFFQRAVFDGI